LNVLYKTVDLRVAVAAVHFLMLVLLLDFCGMIKDTGEAVMLRLLDAAIVVVTFVAIAVRAAVTHFASLLT
jgi:hypothetical protein